MGRTHVALLWCSVSQVHLNWEVSIKQVILLHKAMLHIQEARLMSSWGLTCSWEYSANTSQPSHKKTVYSVDHMIRRVLLWFFLPGHWGISQSPHASSEELPHCLRSHPNLHLAEMPGERTEVCNIMDCSFIYSPKAKADYGKTQTGNILWQLSFWDHYEKV